MSLFFSENVKTSIKDLIDQKNLSQSYEEKINNLREQFPAILDDFKKYYVFYRKNPDYQEYETSFENSKSQLNTINSDITNIKTSILKSTKNINDLVGTINLELRKEKVKNRVLKRRLGKIEHINSGSEEMIADYTEMYRQLFFQNVILFIGSILMVSYVYSQNHKIANIVPQINKNPEAKAK